MKPKRPPRRRKLLPITMKLDFSIEDAAQLFADGTIIINPTVPNAAEAFGYMVESLDNPAKAKRRLAAAKAAVEGGAA